MLHQRFALPQSPSQPCSASGPKTINKRICDIRQLLEQAGYTIQPSPRQLASLDDLYGLATTAGIVIRQRPRRRVNDLQALNSPALRLASEHVSLADSADPGLPDDGQDSGEYRTGGIAR